MAKKNKPKKTIVSKPVSVPLTEFVNFKLLAKSIAFDAALIILIMIIFSVCYVFAVKTAAEIIPGLADVNVQKEVGDAGYEDKFYDMAPSVYSVIIKIAAIVLVFGALTLLAASFFYSQSWLVLKEENFTLKYFTSMLKFNAAWFTLVGALLFVSIYIFPTRVLLGLMPILIALFYTLDYVFRSRFSCNSSVVNNFKSGFLVIKQKPHLLTIFFFGMLILGLAILTLVGLFTYLNANFAFLVLMLLFLAHLSIAKIWALRIAR